MKDILVHVHLYYVEQWDFIEKHLKNINPYKYKLFITMVKKDKEIEEKILNFNNNAKIIITDNIGYDIWPFINLINSINLYDYSYIIKLHTKRFVEQNYSLNGFSMHGYKWRDYLYSFLKSKKDFQKCIKSFEKDEKLGMIGNFKITLKNHKGDKNTTEKTKEIMNKLGYNSNINYIAGSMFMVRAELFNFIKAMKLKKENFPTKLISGISGTFAHNMEQIFGICIIAQGYKIEDIFSFWGYKIQSLILAFSIFLQYFKKFIFQKKITRKGKLIVKILGIPIWNYKIK